MVAISTYPRQYPFTGPKMCTTLSKEANKSGNLECGREDPDNPGEFLEGSVWHSCEEWCLSKVTQNNNFV